MKLALFEIGLKKNVCFLIDILYQYTLFIIVVEIQILNLVDLDNYKQEGAPNK